MEKAIKIRRATDQDYGALVDIQNAIYPDSPTAVQYFVEQDTRRDPGKEFGRWIAESDGCPVGWAQYEQYGWAYDPHRFVITVRVRPDAQQQGIGSALYDTVMAALEPLEPRELWCNVRSDHASALRFVEQRGFAEHMREPSSILDVAAADVTQYAGLEARLRAEGITIHSVRDLAGDPARDQKLYDLDWEVLQDVPGSEDRTKATFESWRTHILNMPRMCHDSYFVALDGDRYVGMSNVFLDHASDMLYTGLTGVRRSYRRRGIATALKVRVILWAKANGKTFIHTGNEEHNPMLQLNYRLGFRPGPAWIDMRQTLGNT